MIITLKRLWKIDQLRHVIGFSLSHRKVNRLESTRESSIPQIDVPFRQINMSPIDLMDHVESDGLEPYEVVRVGWENQYTQDQDSIRFLLEH